MKIKNVRESVENNKNMYLPDNLGEVSDIYDTKTHAEVGVVYAAAVESDAKAQAHKQEVIKKLLQKAKNVIPKDNPSPMPDIKTIYTKKESIELDESLFMDCDEEKNCEKECDEDEDEDKHHLNEMTNDEKEKEEKKLFDKLKQRTGNIYINKFTNEERKRYEELQCISMINSILAYFPGDIKKITADDVIEHEKKSYHDYLKNYIDTLGEDKVKELINGQLEDIVAIHNDTYVDSDGLSYNSIEFKQKPFTESLKAPLTLDNFVPCTKAKPVFDKIVESGKLKEFKTMIEEIYPDELTETELNNILMYESKFIFKTLGI